MKNFLTLYLCSITLLYCQNPNFDQDIIISTNVDSTEVKIGEELNFKIDISSKNKYNISIEEVEIIKENVVFKIPGKLN